MRESPDLIAPITPINRIAIGEIRAAAQRLDGRVLRTPLLRLPADTDESGAEIWLKLENLQPIGSFKLRGAGNAMLLAGSDRLAAGVWTASAGNMAQGVAWNAREMGIACTVVVPDYAPRNKLDAIERLGGVIRKAPFDDWWRILVEHRAPPEWGLEGLFVHPVSDRAVIAGNGTIGLEILEDLQDVDAVVVPYGGGGLSCGIASAIRGSGSAARIFAAEVDTAAPLAASLAAGEPRQIDHKGSFVDGIGGKSVLPEMWPLASTLLSGSIVCGLDEVRGAVRRLVERCRVVAEGAGATSVAAAHRLASACRPTGLVELGHESRSAEGWVAPQRLVCVVSGGNIDTARLAEILGESR